MTTRSPAKPAPRTEPVSKPTLSPTRPATEKPTAQLAIKGATLEWIAADAFTVDPSYDRPANEQRINHMAENWKDEALGVVFASRREDEEKLYLLDGQHRVGALKKQGRKTDLVPALVFDGLSVANEAELFVMMNRNRRALSPSELFKASLVEGDKGAIEIQEVMDSLDMTLDTFSTSHTAIRCVASVWRVYRAMGQAGLDATLSLLSAAWHEEGKATPRNAYNETMVQVVARILYFGEGKIDIERLRQSLRKQTPDELLAKSASIRSLQGGDKTRILGEVILQGYNKGLPVKEQVSPESVRKVKGKKDPFTVSARFRRNPTGKGE